MEQPDDDPLARLPHLPTEITGPVLAPVAGPGRAATLIAQAAPQAPGQFRFDIHLQGEHETVFFDV